MPKLLIKAAAKYFQDLGNAAITQNFIYQGCRSGELPHCRIGNRYVVDTSEIEKCLNAEMQSSIKQKESVEYGLRRVKV